MSRNDQVSFIILHYKNIDDTIECLEYLNKNFNGSHYIVVDNNTLNDIDEKKINKYTFDVIKLSNNMGFAKANNIGINYAKNKYNSNYYVVMNNDVIINDKNFIDAIDKDYKKYDFDLLGTRIESPTGQSVNPFPVIKDRNMLEYEIKKCKKLIKIYNSQLLTSLMNTYIYIKHVLKKPKNPLNSEKLEFNVALHGCCIIFSKKYLEKFDYAFYNETFLFHEEEFLYQRLIKNNLISVYDPNITIFHKEGSSVKKENKTKRLSNLFREKERLKSLELLIKEI